jgi:hypothetical protein
MIYPRFQVIVFLALYLAGTVVPLGSRASAASAGRTALIPFRRKVSRAKIKKKCLQKLKIRIVD